MGPRLSPDGRHGWVVLWVLFLVLGLAACESTPTVPLPADELTLRAAPGGDLPMSFTVLSADGSTAVANAYVRVYDASGAVGTLVTGSAGKTDVLALPSGDYCVSARFIPPGSESLINNEFAVVAPATPPALTGANWDLANLGAVVRARRGYTPVTTGSYSNCVSQLYLSHGGAGTSETIVLAKAHVLKPKAIGLGGEFVEGLTFYAVTKVNVPASWLPPGLDPEVNPAFYNFAGVGNASTDLPVGQGADYAIEVLQRNPDGFNVTGTFEGNTEDSPLLQIAPLFCDQATESFKPGGSGIDFTDANWGYMADRDDYQTPLIVDLEKAAFQLKHTGLGKVTLTIKTNLPMGSWTTTLVYTCVAGVPPESGPSCTAEPVSLSGGNTQTLSVYFQNLAGGKVKATAVLQGIPDDHISLKFDAKAAGDQIPGTARKSATASDIELNQPGKCVLKTSNDPSWWVGEV